MPRGGILTPFFPPSKSGVSRDPTREDSRFLLIDLDADPAALRAVVARLAAEVRPAPGAINAGLTPKWMCDRVAILDALRAALPADNAAEVLS